MTEFIKLHCYSMMDRSKWEITLWNEDNKMIARAAVPWAGTHGKVLADNVTTPLEWDWDQVAEKIDLLLAQPRCEPIDPPSWYKPGVGFILYPGEEG